MSEPRLVQFDVADASELLALSESIHWPHTLADWHTTLASGAVYGHRDEGERILSSSAIFRYGNDLASLGLVIVRPEVRRRGLARQAVLRCLSDAASLPITLVATTEGEPLYKQLGFRTVEMIHNLIAPQGFSLPVRKSCRPMHPEDFPLILQLDQAATGAGRSALLVNRWKQAAAGALLSDGSGFAWRIPQRDRIVIGPIVAPSDCTALELIAYLSDGHSGPVRIDMPARHEKLVRLLIDHGFEIRASRPLMLNAGAQTLPGHRKRLYAFAALAFG
jgi:predicted N-acetyltransferase YhbS